jgi:hemerythrin-like domain-containing protein
MSESSIPIEKLKEDHKELRQLIQAMLALLAESPTQKTLAFSELFEQFIVKLRSHLNLEDQTLYPELLVHEDSHIKNVAARFLTGTRTVNRFFNEYLTHGYFKDGQGRHLKINSEFLKQTYELFDFLDKRITAEEDEFFSVVEKNLKIKNV